MRLKFTHIVALGIVASCTTLSRKANLPPPDLTAFRVPAANEQEASAREEYLVKFKQENAEPQSQWWADYNRALLWQTKQPQTACTLYKSLSSQNEFPLHSLAELRAVEICPNPLNPYETLSNLEKIPWLAPSAVEAGLKLSKMTNDSFREMEFTFQRSFHIEAQKEKVELVQKAMSMAESKQDNETLNRYRARLYLLAPRFLPNPPRDDWFKIAQDYRRVRQFDKAREYYKKIFAHRKSASEEKIKALDGIRLSFKQEGEKAEFLEGTRKMASFVESRFKRDRKGKGAAAYLDAQTTLARALWTEDHKSEALRTLTKAEKRVGAKASMIEVFWLRSRIEEEDGRYYEALRWNQLASQTLTSDQPQWEALVWQRAWLLRKTKNYKEAISRLEELKNRFKDSTSSAKYAFWLGRVLKESADEVRALIEFQQLAQTDPLGYYGIMAQRELGVPFESLTTQPMPKLDKPSFLGEEEYSQILWLLSVGESDVASSLVAKVSTRERGNRLPASELKTLVKFQARFGDYLSLFENLPTWNVEEKQTLLRETPELMFPRPHTDLVGKISATAEVPSELIYSIMRQESAFNTRARSPADAFGLMQLTPWTVRAMEAIENVGYKEHEDLYEPKINIALGGLHLRALLKKWKEQFILTVASYNASEKAVLGWIETRFKSDPVEFIEEIPYAETQGYVKLVLRNFVFYMRLNSKGQAVAFPEWWLDGLQRFKGSSGRAPSQINKVSNNR
ncbi:MAG: transglycosylase SLT domain-containing protein [Bdellovibrionia bacterium]